MSESEILANSDLREEEIDVENDKGSDMPEEVEADKTLPRELAPVSKGKKKTFEDIVNEIVSEDADEEEGEEEKEEEKKGCLQIYGFETVAFIIVIFAFEFFMLFFGFFLLKNGQDKFIDDNPDETVVIDGETVTITHEDETVGQFYGVFVDVAVMIFIGFGLLMAFLRKGGFLSMGLAFLLACIASHWALFVVGYAEILTELINLHENVYEFVVLDIPLMIKSILAAGAVLISMGVVIGKFSPLQMVIFVIIEIPVYAFNVSLVEGILHVSDVGGSMLVHTFGAYFGLFMSWLATPTGIHKDKQYTDKLAATRTSDVFSMLGTVVLWVYWPSFCGALEETYQHRVIVNTYLALTSGCIITFAISRLLRRRFGMPDLQNSTLAAGVAIGTASNMKMPPGAAIGIGLLAGFVSVIGYKYIQKILAKIRIDDTCGVNNLHGMPGIIGGLAGVFASIGMKDELHHGKYQPLIQLAGLAITISIASGAGAIVGLGLRFIKVCYPKTARDYYEDDVYFKLEEEKEQEEYDREVIKEQIISLLEERENAELEERKKADLEAQKNV